MIKASSIARPLCALAAALIAAPLAAQEPTVVTGERQPVYQERVSYADLDLRHGSARQTLKVRVYRAADRLCVPGQWDWTWLGPDLRRPDLPGREAPDRRRDRTRKRRTKSGWECGGAALRPALVRIDYYLPRRTPQLFPRRISAREDAQAPPPFRAGSRRQTPPHPPA